MREARRGIEGRGGEQERGGVERKGEERSNFRSRISSVRNNRRVEG